MLNLIPDSQWCCVRQEDNDKGETRETVEDKDKRAGLHCC